MLEQVGTNNDNPYWATDVFPTLKGKRVAADEECLDDSISMVKTAVGKKKEAPKSALKLSPSKGQQDNWVVTTSDATMVASQNTSISQLTRQVSMIKRRTNRSWIDPANWLPKWRPSCNKPLLNLPNAMPCTFSRVIMYNNNTARWTWFLSPQPGARSSTNTPDHETYLHANHNGYYLFDHVATLSASNWLGNTSTG